MKQTLTFLIVSILFFSSMGLSMGAVPASKQVRSLPSEIAASSSWMQQAKLTASDHADENLFGEAVAIDGDYAVIGAEGNHNYTGAAYVFHYDGASWVQEAKLTATDGAIYDRFGYSVGISGDSIIVGANGLAIGAAYIFVRNGASWSQQAKLTPSDGVNSDEFGFSSAISGDTAVVGAAYGGTGWSGAAYVFKRTETSWAQEAKLTQYDPFPEDQFGWSVAIDGDRIIVGSVYDGYRTGSAYVYTRSGTTWTQEAKLMASDALIEDAFGVSVAIDGDSIAVGAGWKNSFRGAAYVFVKNGTGWTEQAKLVASDGNDGNEFGMAVDISGDRIAVGARFVNMWTGEAYIFDRAGTSWTETAHFNATDGAYFDQFGWDIALDGERVLMGAPGESAPYQGAAYVFWHPVPVLTMNVKGGLGITVSITNNGTLDATNVNVSIGKKYVIIPSIVSGDTETVRIVFFGIGQKSILVSAVCSEGVSIQWSGSAFVLLIFVIGLK